MSKLKVIVGALLILPLLVIAVVIAFILTLDPNRLKPLIADNAAKKGLTLNIQGDIAWRLYPNIGLDVAGVRVANKETSQPLASLKSARLDVALKPLLKREIEVVGIAIDGAELNYIVDSKGQSHWPVIESSSHQPSAPASADSTQAFNIAALFITGLTLNYQDAQGTALKLENLNAEAVGVNLTGKPFGLTLQSNVSYTGYPKARLQSTGSIAVDLNAQRVTLEALNAEVFVGERLRHQKADVLSQVSATANWGEPLSIKSRVTLEGGNIRQLLAKLGIALPATQDPQVFKAFSVQGAIDFTPNALAVEEVLITLDKTTARARLIAKGFEQPAIEAAFNIDRVNADDYLPPALDKSAPKTAAKSDEPVPQPLPFDMLRPLNAEVNVVVGALKVKGVDVSDINLTLSAQDGLIALKPVRVKLAEGTVTSELTLDVRGHSLQAQTQTQTKLKSHQKQQAKLQGFVATKGIQLAPLLAQFKQEPLLAGSFISRIAFASHGHTDQDLTKNLEASMEVSSDSLKLTHINIEKSFCEAVNVLSSKPELTAKWPEYSELSPVNFKASYAKNIIELISLSADIQKLKASSFGELNLATGDFRFPVDVSLADFASGLEGCPSVDVKWRKRTVPLRCKGNLINIGARTCLPDGPRMTQMLKNKAKDEVSQQLDKAKDKVENKAKKEADRFLEKHIDDEKVDALKQSVKGILKLK